MKKIILDAHTIKIMNEQCIAKKDGDQYINKCGQSWDGDLFFIFNKEYRGMPSKLLYTLTIKFVCANGNSTKIYHRLNGDDLEMLYNYVSLRSDSITYDKAMGIVNNLNDHYRQFETTIGA